MRRIRGYTGYVVRGVGTSAGGCCAVPTTSDRSVERSALRRRRLGRGQIGPALPTMMAFLVLVGGCHRCCPEAPPGLPVLPINGMDRTLGPGNATLVFQTELPRDQGSAQIHARPPLPGSDLIKVELYQTNMKDPCVRVEREIPAPGSGEVKRAAVAMVANQIIVRLRDSFSELELPVLLKATESRLVRRLLAPRTYLVEVPTISCAPPSAQTVRALPMALRDFESRGTAVEYAEANFLFFADATPDDPEMGQLWAFDNAGWGGTKDADIDAPEGWDIIKQSPDIVVAVIDTGIDGSHDDLMANLWTNTSEANGAAGLDDDGNGFTDDTIGWDFYNGDDDPLDVDGHGTHVAGTIGAVGDNGVGVVGVSWSVRLMPLKFMENWAGVTADAADAVYYATSKNVDIMSNSWGGGAYSLTLELAIDDAEQHDILFVAAAGNERGNDNDLMPHYPSSYGLPNIIAVAATNKFDLFAGFSSYGVTSVDIAAPGVDILSTGRPNSYTVKSGTSMAAAHVSGACALMRQLHRGATYETIKSLVLESVDTNDSLTSRCVTGGRLNLDKALRHPGAAG